MNGIWKGFFAGVLVLGVFLYACNGLLNIDNSEIFSDISHAAPMMAQIFGVVGLVWMIVYSVLSSESSKIKLIGSGLVLSLAFASNNVWTYALSIFIVATLVTELQFLEKLAAMFTNRDKYWDYLAKQSTPEESKQKAILEAIESVEVDESLASKGEGGTVQEPAEQQGPSENGPEPLKDKVIQEPVEKFSLQSQDSAVELTHGSKSDGKSTSIESRARDILEFNKSAVFALKKYVSHLEGASVLANMQFSSREDSFEVDAIIKSSFADYVVEIKNTRSAVVLLKALLALTGLVKKYSSLLKSAGEGKKVKGVLIIPAGVWGHRRPSMEHIVLELDPRTNTLRHIGGNWE